MYTHLNVLICVPWTTHMMHFQKHSNRFRPSEVPRTTLHKDILHSILNNALIARRLNRCDLAHWDRFPGFDSGWRSLFLTS